MDLCLKELSISDKDILSPYLLSNKYGICDFSFSNIFMWRHTYKANYTIHRGFLVILTSSFEGERHFFMPLGEGDLQAVIADMVEYSNVRGEDFKMLGLTPEMIEELGFLGSDFIVRPAEIWDYIYSSEDLITLKGKKFHGKRNHINKFDAMYNYEYFPLAPEHVPSCLELLGAWNEDNDAADPSIKAENRAVREALENYSVLGLSGGCLFIDGKLGAFALGQPANSEVFVIHAEKALYEYEGIYSKINQCFAAHNCADFRYINREEDMGIEGLRKAKMSYNPVRLLTKSAGVLPFVRESGKPEDSSLFELSTSERVGG